MYEGPITPPSVLRNLLNPTVPNHEVWTYSRLEPEANRLARAFLAHGLEPGDRIALLLPNRPETLLVYLACFKAALVAVPMDYRYRPPQINYVLRHSGSRLLVTHADRLDEVAECKDAQQVEVAVVGGEGGRHGARPLADWPAPPGDAPPADEYRPDDVAIIFYTSGTTGRPKGVMLTRAAVAAETTACLARVPLDASDVALVSAPITRRSPCAPWSCRPCTPAAVSSCWRNSQQRTIWPPFADRPPRRSWA